VLGEPGGFAHRRFLEVYAPWRVKVRRIFPLAVVPLVGWLVAVSVIWPRQFQLLLGIAIGAMLALYADLVDSPPEWIDKWRRGRDGERRTHRELRRLANAGWTIAHDLDDPGWGNLDHVVVGPNGVFLLETKNLSGTLSIDEGALVISHGHERLDRFANHRLAKQMPAKAAALCAELRRAAVPDVRFVRAVVVLWGDFDQPSADLPNVTFVRGVDLRDWLTSQSGLMPTASRDKARRYLEERVAAQPSSR
jgi:hypothetical protein